MTPRMRVQKCNPQLATQLATQLAICELYVDDTPRFFDTVGRAITVWWPFSFNTLCEVYFWVGACTSLYAGVIFVTTNPFSTARFSTCESRQMPFAWKRLTTWFGYAFSASIGCKACANLVVFV
jgi:hypothetical protein